MIGNLITALGLRRHMGATKDNRWTFSPSAQVFQLPHNKKTLILPQTASPSDKLICYFGMLIQHQFKQNPTKFCPTQSNS